MTIETQAQIDSFAANYPDCSQLSEEFTISGNDITNLAGLSQLEDTTRVFSIIVNPLLVRANELNLDLVASPATISISVWNNPLLTTLPSFTQGTEGIFQIHVAGNPSLLNLNGF